jgi:hypothetical protein
MYYIPDHWFREKQKIDRDFLWGILNSMKNEFTVQLVANANKERMVKSDLINEELTVQVCQDVA